VQESDNNSNSLAIYNVTHKLAKNEQKHENNLKLHIWKTEVYNVYVQVNALKWWANLIYVLYNQTERKQIQNIQFHLYTYCLQQKNSNCNLPRQASYVSTVDS